MCYNAMDILLGTYHVYIPPHYLEDYHLANPKIRSHCTIFVDCMLKETTGDNRADFEILINQCSYDHCRDILHA